MPRLPITNIVKIYQFERTGNTESYPATPTYEDVNACISPTGTDIQSSYGDVASYQLFEIFLYDVTLTIKNGDKIVDENNTAYLVDGQPYVINNAYMQYIRVLAKLVV